ncbi:MAG: tetratricopeptide repeat protein [Crocosphaera sp.]
MKLISYQQNKILEPITNWDKTLKIYNGSISDNPQNPWAYNHRGVLYKEQDKMELALDDLNRAIKLDPEYAFAYNNRGEIYDNLGKIELALADYSEAINYNPKYISAYVNRGNLYSIQEKFSLAMSDYDKIVKLKSDENWIYNRGTIHYQQQKWELAFDNFHQATDINRKHAPSWINMGLINYEIGELTKAIQCFKQAVAINPELEEAKLAFLVTAFSLKKISNLDAYLGFLKKLGKKYIIINFLGENLWGTSLIQKTESLLQLIDYEYKLKLLSRNA